MIQQAINKVIGAAAMANKYHDAKKMSESQMRLQEQKLAIQKQKLNLERRKMRLKEKQFKTTEMNKTEAKEKEANTVSIGGQKVDIRTLPKHIQSQLKGGNK